MQTSSSKKLNYFKMKNHLKTNCEKCEQKVSSFKHLKKTREGYICGKCVTKKRLEHREFLKRNVLGIRKRSDLKEEWARKRKLRKAINTPKIKSIKNKPKISALGTYLTRNEKNMLYRLLIRKGMDSKQVKERIQNLSKQLIESRNKLKQEKLSKKEMDKKFKEEFTRMLESEK